MFNLVIVDFQKDFYDQKEGALAVPGADVALANIINFMKTHWYEINNVFITQDMHPENHCSFKSNGGIWPEHCVANTPGAEVHPEILQVCKDYGFRVINITKGTNPKFDEYSAFATPGNRMKLDTSNTTFIVCGLAGDYCVMETYKDIVKYFHQYGVFIYTTGCASIDNTKFSELIKENKVLTIQYV